MKVVHYISSLSKKSGGVGIYMQILSKELGKITELHIITKKCDDELKLENSIVHVISPFIISSFGKKMKSEWISFLNMIQPDIVHINGCWMPEHAYTAIWAKKAGFKVIITPHGMLEPWDIKKNFWTKKLPALLLYQKRAVKLSDCLIATSEVEKKNLIELNYNKNVAIIPNGIDVEKIALKNNWKKRKQILFLALLRKNKGADYIIRAVKHLRDELEGYKIIIAGTVGYGEENYVRNLHQMIKEYELENIISMPGGVYGEEKWKLYQESDYFILPTLNENFGIVIAESLLSGTPVITCKGAPWPEIEKYKCGWWIDRTDDKLVEALRDAIHSSDEFREYMGRNGRKLVEKKYSSRNVAEKMVKKYEEIINNKLPR